jgi:proteic killer suppression protein
MIGTFRHKGLRRFFEEDDPRGVNPEHVQTLRDILATLHAAPTLVHLRQPGLRLHPLKGEMKGFWSITVRANRRVVFRFDDGVEDVDYVDYH